MQNTTNTVRPLTLSERLEAAEKKLTTLDEVVTLRTEQIAKQFGSALGNVVEALNAIIKLQPAGFDMKVEEQIKADRTARRVAEIDRATQMLQTLIDNKTLVASDLVTEESVLVGTEFDASGASVGRAQIEFKQFEEAARVGLLGKTVGTKFEAPNGGFLVNEIYVVNPNPPKATETDSAVISAAAPVVTTEA